jgi:hypothetical protein
LLIDRVEISVPTTYRHRQGALSHHLNHRLAA